ncbi:zinc metalloprotease [Streptomyces olivaceoviridis]|uniref:hypothetical protein n=1 Tax=Streptomyces olivaceoviridis TaxID=1921 RepID=UPI0036FEB453
MPTPKPARTSRTLAALIAASLTALALLLAGATDARAATTPGYKGTGWKADTANGIYSISPDPYTVVFANTTARSKLSKYFTGPSAQLAGIGIRVAVSTTIDTSTTACPARHRIIVHYTYRPMGTKGMSQARSCYSTADGSAWGGHILMDSEYWTSSTWFSANATTNEARRKDAVSHELGHILGLAHPNVDLDKDGIVENGECVRNASGLRPLMCSPNRSNPPVAEGGKFTREFDIPGLRQMLANYYLRQT